MNETKKTNRFARGNRLLSEKDNDSNRN